jgi:amino acid adenylation domain-containing protein
LNLHDLVVRAAISTPDAPAIRAPDLCLTYRELDELADRLALALAQRGVGPGDRVGVWLDKGALAVACFQAICRLGAAYVPIDPWSPASRARAVALDADPRVVVTSAEREKALDLPCAWAVEPGDLPPRAPVPPVRRDLSDLAYILYTSGSTGTPKGVCLSHQNALSFVEWAVQTLRPGPGDRFANHAPFHFDLSVLDLYAAFSVGACVCLVPDGVAADPRALVAFACEEQITVWYSTPSVLLWMMDDGGLLEVPDLPWRIVLFAGEAFPIRPLRRLMERWPGRRYLNLYGPTETNVCTFYEVTELAADRERPVPIGQACCGDRAWAVTSEGKVAGPGEEGELWVEGPTVMLGYRGGPPRGEAPYATGDLVRVLEDGGFEYLGRRDARLKVRGYRIEPGDIEATLATHPDVREVCVVAAGEGIEARLVAFVVPRESRAPGLLELKRLCAERLPRYMVVDAVRVVDSLPRNRNGKVDRTGLSARATRRD